MKPALALALAVLAGSCAAPPSVSPRYVLGPPYQAGGVWYYPRERYEGEETGLATVYSSDHAELTTDGEAFDQSALAAAHQTLQLPAIVRLTNLENGLQATVRINDRGPATPHRLIEVTRRTAAVLRFPNHAVRVRLEVLPAESYAAADAVPGVPKLQLTAAPLGKVEQADLPPLGAAAQVAAVQPAVSPQRHAAPATPAATVLAEALAQTAPDPGQLYITLGTFQKYQYANVLRTRLANLGAGIFSRREGRLQIHRVMIGPLQTVQQADMMLDQVLRSGVTDARIVVE